MKFKKVLAIETSCDDTSVAVVRHDGFVEKLVSQNQDEEHKPFGGIVPEVACRNHTLQLLPLIDQLIPKDEWSSIDGIVVTNRPGLIGSLIVGLVTAKALSQSMNKPFIGVNHLEGHILAPFLRDENYQPTFSFEEPFIALAISGGHTTLYEVKGLGQYHVMGSTLDDAAGEAFDKFAKMLGLGFPGGVQIDKLAQKAKPLKEREKNYIFPRSLIKEEHYNMSFSGLKASSQRLLDSLPKEEIEKNIHEICAYFQESIVDVLIAKLDRAVQKTGIKNIVITGGVSANSGLREASKQWAQSKKLKLMIPPLKFCTDNAAMIGYAGILRLNRGEHGELDLGPSPQVYESDFT